MNHGSDTSAPENALAEAVERATPMLRAISDELAAMRSAPGKWSRKEILGHLIDSASNNHQRFIRARFQEDLIFPGYDQDEWVRAQRYAEAPWESLVTLWREFNLHLVRAIGAIPSDLRQMARTRHNLHRIALHGVPEDQPTTLEYFMFDYVRHLEHHLGQILPEYPRVMQG
jgi:hypothetical protein